MSPCAALPSLHSREWTFLSAEMLHSDFSNPMTALSPLGFFCNKWHICMYPWGHFSPSLRQCFFFAGFGNDRGGSFTSPSPYSSRCFVLDSLVLVLLSLYDPSSQQGFIFSKKNCYFLSVSHSLASTVLSEPLD